MTHRNDYNNHARDVRQVGLLVFRFGPAAHHLLPAVLRTDHDRRIAAMEMVLLEAAAGQPINQQRLAEIDAALQQALRRYRLRPAAASARHSANRPRRRPKARVWRARARQYLQRSVGE